MSDPCRAFSNRSSLLNCTLASANTRTRFCVACPSEGGWVCQTATCHEIVRIAACSIDSQWLDLCKLDVTIGAMTLIGVALLMAHVLNRSSQLLDARLKRYSPYFLLAWVGGIILCLLTNPVRIRSQWLPLAGFGPFVVPLLYRQHIDPDDVRGFDNLLLLLLNTSIWIFSITRFFLDHGSYSWWGFFIPALGVVAGSIWHGAVYPPELPVEPDEPPSTSARWLEQLAAVVSCCSIVMILTGLWPIELSCTMIFLLVSVLRCVMLLKVQCRPLIGMQVLRHVIPCVCAVVALDLVHAFRPNPVLRHVCGASAIAAVAVTMFELAQLRKHKWRQCLLCDPLYVRAVVCATIQTKVLADIILDYVGPLDSLRDPFLDAVNPLAYEYLPIHEPDEI